ncbi:MAG: DUF86 domain-containing protein [Deltaproteobacteria bacterium]|nr:DUF86 domain-containing protein [Deltaproteobacteria bacterium]
MTPSTLRAAVVAERAAWVREMLACVRGLPLGSTDEFFSDARNVAAAESYLRRALEALLDLGRHVLAKGFGVAPSEYKEVARGLERVGVLAPDVARTLVVLAGYRNRMVHFYHEVGPQELYEVCSQRLGDVEAVLDAVLAWCRGHPERFDAPVE